MRSDFRRRVAPVLVAAVMAVATGSAGASPQTMVEPRRVELAVRGAGQPPDPLAVRRVILAAAATRGWQATSDQPGMVTLVASAREHSATVDVVYDAGGFLLRYRDSVGLDHAVDGDRTVIHPRYNKWVTELSNEIRREARDAVPQRGGNAAPAAASAQSP